MKTNAYCLSILRCLSMIGLFVALLSHCLRLPAQSTQKVSLQEDEGAVGDADCWKRLFTPPVTMVCLEPHKPTIVTGQKGVEAMVNPDDFVHADGSPIIGAVEIRMTEVMDKAGLILGNLPTVSDGKMLESAGVVKLEAFADGKAVKLKAGKSVALRFPNGKQPGMQLFEGTHANATEMNWKTIPSSGAVNAGRASGQGYGREFWEPNLLKKVKPYTEEGLALARKYKFQITGKSIPAFIEKEVAANYPCFGRGTFIVHFRAGVSSIPRSIDVSSQDSECMALAILEVASRLRWNFRWRIKTGVSIPVKISIPAKGREGQTTFVSIADNPNVKLDATTKAALKELHVQRKKREEAYKQREFGRYAMNTTKLGWINCDRFTNYKPIISMTVTSVSSLPYVQSFIVFDRIKAVLPGHNNMNNGFTFSGIPAGMQAKVVSFAYDKTQGIQMAIMPLVTKAGNGGKLELQPITEAEMKAKLAAL